MRISSDMHVMAHNGTSLEIPWQKTPKKSVYPIFLPFFGCARKCIFCSQEKQSGSLRIGDAARLKHILQETGNNLEKKTFTGEPPELAFYGGTFTAISPELFRECLEFAQSLIKRGLISSFRCSTRPDCVSGGVLEQLRDAGCGMVELGVQTFNDEALGLSARRYAGQTCIDACGRIQDKGINFGVHLMPGLPGVGAGIFLEDVRLALDLGAVCLRFHPCLVLEGTKLAEIWRDGAYVPWSIGRTVHILAKAWLMAHRRDVPVIRMGLAPQEELLGDILAGPWHAALGSRIMAIALFMETAILKQKLGRVSGRLRFTAPKHAQGYILGWQGEMEKKWRKLGLNREEIRFWDRNFLKLEYL